jgi:hypothetical protein
VFHHLPPYHCLYIKSHFASPYLSSYLYRGYRAMLRYSPSSHSSHTLTLILHSHHHHTTIYTPYTI